jgi:hypothetical protein
MTGLCYKCRGKHGYKPKDQGFHTARTKACTDCGEITGILPDRHWVAPVDTQAEVAE